MPTPLQQTPSIVWGVLSFVAPGATASNFDIEAMGEWHFGNPEPIFETVRSLLIDGSLVTRTHDDNRTVPIRLRVSANDGESSAEAEAALVAQERQVQPPPIEYTSPLGLSATSVFDTVVARLDRDTSEGWDVDEKERGYRYYLLTLTCLPFARAVESTIVPALPVPPDPDAAVVVVVDDCTDVTPAGTYAGEWTVETNATAPTGPTATTFNSVDVIEATGNDLLAGGHLRLPRTFDTPLTVPADHYLVVDVDILVVAGLTYTPDGEWKIQNGTTTLTPILVLPYGGLGNFVRLFFEAPPTAISTLRTEYDFTESGDEFQLRVSQVFYTDTLGYSATSTLRQQARTVTVAGSTPTQAALRLFVADDAEPLGGDILVHTSTNTDWQPNLSPWYDSGGTETPDAGAISGRYVALDTPAKHLIPADLLRPGAYAMVGRFVTDDFAALTLSWTARMVNDAGAATIGSSRTVSGEIELPDMGGLPNYVMLDIGALHLPVVEVETPDYQVEIVFSGSAAIGLDEILLLSLDDGATTWIKDPDNMTAVEIRSPELGAARPSVWGGYETRRANIDWACESFGAHRFEPGAMRIFFVTTGTALAQCEIEFFPRFHGNVWGGGTS